ncbi:MAG: lactoylglutathione lyase [Ignavibacteria bacterium]|nr:lactoylglutathione lyase [Ignavibacteria bacterium]
MVEFILYVRNQEESKNFYKILLNKEPSLDVPGMTEFLLEENCKLGLMPNDGIVKILGDKTPHPYAGTGIPRCELYLSFENPVEVFKRSINAGAKEISPIQKRSWGDSAGYLSDADGHIIAIVQK